MQAEIITIGDEILIGQIIDTNSSWLGQELGKLGIRVAYRSSVGDKKEDILDAISNAINRNHLVIITGGLGPTKDDITKHTLAEFFNTTLIEDAKVKEWVTKIFKQRNLPMLDTNLAQAMVPASCKVLFNRSGTAPGMWFETEQRKVVISLPGVPFEMKTIFTEECVPLLNAHFTLPNILHRTILTCGIGESFLAKKISAIEDTLPAHISLAYLPSVGMVRLRFSGSSSNQQLLFEEMNQIIASLYEVVGEYIYGEENDTLEMNIGLLLKSSSKTIATAESCTGGFISHMLTSVPGSSSYYKGSVVAYANEIKIQELGVSEELLKTHGAVSEACVKQMAEQIRHKFKVDVGVATSGIAGPDGGTDLKPVGTVWIAVADEFETITSQFNMGDNRERTILRTGITALDLVRKQLIKH